MILDLPIMFFMINNLPSAEKENILMEGTAYNLKVKKPRIEN